MLQEVKDTGKTLGNALNIKRKWNCLEKNGVKYGFEIMRNTVIEMATLAFWTV